MFLVNGMSSLVLFDSEVSRSFVSLVFCKSFFIPHGALDHPLVVESADAHIASASRVYQGCVLEIFDMKFPIDLVHIP